MSISGYSHNFNRSAVWTSGNVFTITNSINPGYYIYTLSWVDTTTLVGISGVIFSGGGISYEIIGAYSGSRSYIVIGVYSTINSSGASQFTFSGPTSVIFSVDRFTNVNGISDYASYNDDGTNVSTTISLTNTGQPKHLNGTYIIGFDLVNSMSLPSNLIELYQSNSGIGVANYPKFITGYSPYFFNDVSYNSSDQSVYPSLVTFHFNSTETSTSGSRSLMGCGQ